MYNVFKAQMDQYNTVLQFERIEVNLIGLHVQAELVKFTCIC